MFYPFRNTKWYYNTITVDKFNGVDLFEMEEKDSLKNDINVYKEGWDIIKNYFRHDYSIHVYLVNKDICDIAVAKIIFY